MAALRLPRIGLKRAYEAGSMDDGLRLLVERLWPRRVRRCDAGIDHWFKDLAPSAELRRWYDHAPERWPGFRRRYSDELNAVEQSAVEAIVSLCTNHRVTFIFAARDEARNSAVVLREYVLEKI